LLSAEALVDSVIVESALKGITQRARPMTGVERSEFFDGGNSFPSVIARRLGPSRRLLRMNITDRRAVQIAAYGAATAVSVARFTGQKHYLSDVVAGSALGFAIGRYVYTTHHRSGPVSQLTFFPQFNRAARAYGLSLTWNF
jgi:membrane-associated phospholipid phosphatase